MKSERSGQDQRSTRRNRQSVPSERLRHTAQNERIPQAEFAVKDPKTTPSASRPEPKQNIGGRPRSSPAVRGTKKEPRPAAAAVSQGMAVSEAPEVRLEAPKQTFAEWIKAKWLLDEDLPENEYYLRIASRYRLVKYAVIAIALSLLLGMMAAYSEDITVENFRYLLRDLDMGNTKYTGIYETIHYDGGSDLEFAMYKGDLVVVRAGQVSIFGMNGGTVMNSGNAYYNPTLLSGKKYFLVYDSGKTSCSFSLYNAFSLLHSKQLETPIYDAALSDEGSFAIVTDASGYRGVVQIYDKDFELLTTVFKDKYIWDVALSQDAERLLVLSAYDVNGMWYSEVHLLSARNGETMMQFVIPDIPGYACHFLKNGGFCILTENGMQYYATGNTEVQTVSFEETIPVSWSFGDTYAAVIFNRTILGQDQVLRVMKQGALVREYQPQEEIVQTVFFGDILYVLTETRIYRIDCVSGETETLDVDEGCRELLPIDEEHLMLCFGNHARTVNPKTDFSKQE